MQNIGMKNLLFWMTIGCSGYLAWLLFKAWRGLKTRHWYRTTGIVQSVTMHEKGQGDDDVAYYLSVQYEYEVNGKVFKSNRLTYSETTQLSYDRATNLLRGLAVGKKTPIFYNPNRLGESVIHKSIDGGSLFKLFLIGFVALAGWMVIAFKGSGQHG